MARNKPKAGEEQESAFSVTFSSFEDNPEPGGPFDGFGHSFNNFPPANKETDLELLSCEDAAPPAKKAKPSELQVAHGTEKEQKSELEDLIQGLGDNSRDVFLKLSSHFSQCESFESLCPKHLDEIIRDALACEETLKQQKQRIVTRLEQLSKTLQTQ